MTKFSRIQREHSIKIHAPIKNVFSVLCLVRESEWLPTFSSEIVFSNSGFTELDSIFFTHSDEKDPIVWIIPAYNHYDFIEMIYIQPNIKTVIIKLYLSELTSENTQLRVHYIYTALSEIGNKEIEQIKEKNFIENINSWQLCLNYYFKNGSIIPKDLLSLHYHA